MKISRFSSVLIVVVICLVILIAGLMYKSPQIKSWIGIRQQRVEVIAPAILPPRVYRNTPLHFSFELPSYIRTIDDQGKTVEFKESSEDWLIAISALQTELKTTRDWIDAQSKEGFRFIKWIGPQTDGKALLAERVHSYEYDKDVIETTPRVMIVKNGTLYMIEIKKYFGENETPTLDPELMNALETLQVSGLVTTDATGSYIIIRNSSCGATFHVPPGWADYGILGESKIVSPEDQRTNEEWDKANQDLIKNEEGDAPLGPDARSLYLSCQDADARSHDGDKKLSINGHVAYEVINTGRMPDGTPITNYSIVIKKEKTMTIELGQTEYDKLPDTVKQIIQSISFEK